MKGVGFVLLFVWVLGGFCAHAQESVTTWLQELELVQQEDIQNFYNRLPALSVPEVQRTLQQLAQEIRNISHRTLVRIEPQPLAREPYRQADQTQERREIVEHFSQAQIEQKIQTALLLAVLLVERMNPPLLLTRGLDQPIEPIEKYKGYKFTKYFMTMVSAAIVASGAYWNMVIVPGSLYPQAEAMLPYAVMLSGVMSYFLFKIWHRSIFGAVSTRQVARRLRLLEYFIKQVSAATGVSISKKNLRHYTRQGNLTKISQFLCQNMLRSHEGSLAAEGVRVQLETSQNQLEAPEVSPYVRETLQSLRLKK